MVRQSDGDSAEPGESIKAAPDTRDDDIRARLERIEALLADGAKTEADTTAAPVEAKAQVDWYKRATDTLAVATLIAGFVLTYLQVGRWQESTDLSAWNAVSQKWLEVDSFFVQNAALRKHFYEGVPIRPDDVNYDKALAAGYFVLNFIDYAVSTSNHVVTKYPDTKTLIQPNVWESYLRATYFRSPVVCNLLRRIPEGYSLEARRIGLDACKSVQG